MPRPRDGTALSACGTEDLGIERRHPEFEAATKTARAGRLDHIGARTDLDAVTVELMEIVRVLDGINRFRFGKDPEAMAEWLAAKHEPGLPSRTASTSRSGPTPPSTGGVASAA